VALACYAFPATHPSGAIYLRDDAEGAPHDFEQASERFRRRRPSAYSDGTLVTNFRDLVDETLIVKSTPSGSTVVPAEDVQETDPSVERLLTALT
jgi:hypothetical protein